MDLTAAYRECVKLLWLSVRAISPKFWGSIHLEITFKDGGIVHVEAYHKSKWRMEA